MLKATLNSSLWFIRTKKLYSDGDGLSIVYCTQSQIATAHEYALEPSIHPFLPWSLLCTSNSIQKMTTLIVQVTFMVFGSFGLNAKEPM